MIPNLLRVTTFELIVKDFAEYFEVSVPKW